MDLFQLWKQVEILEEEPEMLYKLAELFITSFIKSLN
jgi:hypothetical protein